MFTKLEAVILNMDRFSVKEDKIDAIIKRNPKSQLYEIEPTSLSKAKHGKVPSNINIWHKRLAHRNVKVLKSLCENTEDVPRLKGKLNYAIHA